MENKVNLRNRITGYVMLVYLVPLLFLVGYTAHLIPLDTSWMILTGGIFLSVAGSISLIVKLYSWESVILEEIDLLADSKAAFLIQRNGVTIESGTEENKVDNEEENVKAQEEIVRLQSISEESYRVQLELEEKVKEREERLELAAKENEQLLYELEQLKQDLQFFQQTSKEQLRQKDAILVEYSQNVKDLRAAMEKKQQNIAKLESSVNDLTYEVKTLLHLSEFESDSKPKANPSSFWEAPVEKIESKNPQLHTAAEASLQLRRCINIAQKLTGASHFEFSSRFRDFSSDNFALEQRRLFDSLRSETNSLVLVYSLKEEKILFVNDETKQLLGWSPDRFIQEFPSILHTSYPDWKRSISSLANKAEVQETLLLKARSGQEVSCSCHLGIIPTGMFKNHMIGILYTDQLASIGQAS